MPGMLMVSKGKHQRWSKGTGGGPKRNNRILNTFARACMRYEMDSGSCVLGDQLS